jgi:hypothetical protein
MYNAVEMRRGIVRNVRQALGARGRPNGMTTYFEIDGAPCEVHDDLSDHQALLFRTMFGIPTRFVEGRSVAIAGKPAFNGRFVVLAARFDCADVEKPGRGTVPYHHAVLPLAA